MVVRGLVGEVLPCRQRNGPGSEHLFTVTERSMRQSLLCLGTLGANAYNLSSVKFSEMKDGLEAALQRAIDNHAGHNEVLAEFDPFVAPLPSAPAQKARPDVMLFGRWQRTSGLLITAPCGRNTIEARTLVEVFAAHSAFRWWTRHVRVSTPASDTSGIS